MIRQFLPLLLIFYSCASFVPERKIYFETRFLPAMNRCVKTKNAECLEHLLFKAKNDPMVKKGALCFLYSALYEVTGNIKYLLFQLKNKECPSRFENRALYHAFLHTKDLGLKLKILKLLDGTVYFSYLAKTLLKRLDHRGRVLFLTYYLKTVKSFQAKMFLLKEAVFELKKQFLRFSFEVFVLLAGQDYLCDSCLKCVTVSEKLPNLNANFVKRCLLYREEMFKLLIDYLVINKKTRCLKQVINNNARSGSFLKSVCKRLLLEKEKGFFKLKVYCLKTFIKNHKKSLYLDNAYYHLVKLLKDAGENTEKVMEGFKNDRGKSGLFFEAQKYIKEVRRK